MLASVALRTLHPDPVADWRICFTMFGLLHMQSLSLITNPINQGHNNLAKSLHGRCLSVYMFVLSIDEYSTDWTIGQAGSIGKARRQGKC